MSTHRYRKEEAFRERPTDGFGGHGERMGTQGGFPHREGRASGTLIVEHGHGNIDSRGPPRWKQIDNIRNRGPNHDREIHPRQRGPSQERVRKTNSRSDTRAETRGRPVHDGRRDFGHEPRRSPMNFPNRGGRGGPLNHRGRSSPGPARGRRNPGRGGRMEMGPSRNHPRIQQSPQGHQDPPQTRSGFRPREEDWDMDPREEESRWAKETPELPQWEGDKPGIMDRRPPRDVMEPEMPSHRESWNHQQNRSEMTVVTEETLTIKVDMKRPTNENRYSILISPTKKSRVKGESSRLFPQLTESCSRKSSEEAHWRFDVDWLLKWRWGKQPHFTRPWQETTWHKCAFIKLTTQIVEQPVPLNNKPHIFCEVIKKWNLLPFNTSGPDPQYTFQCSSKDSSTCHYSSICTSQKAKEVRGQEKAPITWNLSSSKNMHCWTAFGT